MAATDPPAPGVSLGSSDAPLLDRHDALLVDLDGVVHLGPEPVPGAAETLAAARHRGLRITFVTNNASRPVVDVVAALAAIGVPAGPGEVLTSATATAELLAGELPAGAPVLVVGGPGLRGALTDAGLSVVATAEESPAAVVQGWAPEVGWPQLAEACVALRAGVRWVVTNRDATLPSPRGPLPGSGSLVAALVTATGREPDAVVGKPMPVLFELARREAAAPLVVGDRLDTDIAGARAAGLPSLLVLSGVADPAGLLAADAAARPTYVGRDISAVRRAHPQVRLRAGTAGCDGVQVEATGRVRGEAAAAGDGLDVLRAACALAWAGQLPPDCYDRVLSHLDLDG